MNESVPIPAAAASAAVINRDDLHLSDLARLRAAAGHGYVAALWRDPRRPDTRYSLMRLERDEATITRYVDSETLAECVVIPVADILEMIR